MAELTRREAIAITAGAAIAASLNAQQTHRFFTPEEFRLVDELSEMIIPADDRSPGAHAAQVAAYIDQQLAESLLDDPRKAWREGLKRMAEILGESTPEQKLAILTRIAASEEESFFPELKSRTVG